MRKVAGATPEQVELMREAPAWEARLAAAHTIPRELRTARELAFTPDRFRDCDVPTLLLQGEDSCRSLTRTEPKPCARRCPTPASPSFRGQRHTAMDTATELFTAEVLGFVTSR